MGYVVTNTTRPEAGHPLPDLADFETLVRRAYDGLPKAFRDVSSEVAIRVEELPDRETLEALDIGHPLNLLGLYHGVNLAHKSVLDPGGRMDMVFIYRQPILAYWPASGSTIEEIVTHVLIHEFGHHFGLSDDDMQDIERDA